MSNDRELWAPEKKTVPLIPNWKAAAEINIMAFESGTAEGKELAKEGIREMAAKFDALIKEAHEAGIVEDPNHGWR